MLLISGTFLYCSYLKAALISFTKPVLCARSRTVALQTETERDVAPTLMAKKSVLMCFKRLDNEDSIVKQGKKHIYSLFPRGTKRFKKNGTWACVPSRGGREDKSKSQTNRLLFASHN